jgi:hypothetical protein
MPECDGARGPGASRGDFGDKGVEKADSLTSLCTAQLFVRLPEYNGPGFLNSENARLSKATTHLRPTLW